MIYLISLAGLCCFVNSIICEVVCYAYGHNGVLRTTVYFEYLGDTNLFLSIQILHNITNIDRKSYITQSNTQYKI